MNTSSLYMDNIFPKLATNFAQIIGDYYEKTTIHFFLSLFVGCRRIRPKDFDAERLPRNRYRKQPVLGKQTQGDAEKQIWSF